MLSVCTGAFVVTVYLHTKALEQISKGGNSNVKWYVKLGN